MTIIVQPARPERMIHGGSWNNDPIVARVAHRLGSSPGLRYDDLGLRVIVVMK